jgi:hypothetical protein
VSEGPFLSWHGEGQKKTEGFFHQGAASGRWRSWYDNGQLRSVGRYEAGERTGQWQRYERDGSPLAPPQETTVEIEEARPRHVIGVEECDYFLERYADCVDTKAPEATREQIHAALAIAAEAWQTAAATNAGREGLSHACKAALEAVRETSKAWGCEF